MNTTHIVFLISSFSPSGRKCKNVAADIYNVMKIFKYDRSYNHATIAVAQE